MSVSPVAGPIVLAPVTQPVTQAAATSGGSSIRSGIRQLGSDLNAGNLAAAQQDYATLSQSGPLTSKNSSNPLVQDLQAVGTALQSGNLQGAQTAFSTFQSAAQQQVAQAQSGPRNSHHSGGHHHIGGGDSGSGSDSQTNPLAQAFTSLEQALQSNNLSSAQSAFATIQADLQQAGFSFGGSSNGSTTTGSNPAAVGATPTSAPATVGAGLNVTA